MAVCYHEVAVKPGESLGQYQAQVTRKHQFYFKPKKQAEKEGAKLELLQEGHFVLCRSVPFSTFEKFQHALWAAGTLNGLPGKPLVLR